MLVVEISALTVIWLTLLENELTMNILNFGEHQAQLLLGPF